MKDLLKATADSSGYHLYQVEDIVKHFVAHTQLAIMKGTKVKIDGLGYLTMHETKGRTFVSGITKQLSHSQPSKYISIKTDRRFGDYMTSQMQSCQDAK